MKLLTFFLFLCANGVFWFLSVKLTEALGQPRLHGARFFWVIEAFILFSVGSTFAFIYILSGLWNLRLVIQFLAASQLGIFLGAFLNAILGSSSEQSRARIKAAGAEIGLRYPRITLTMMALSLLIFVGYVIAGAIIHFRYPWNSQALHIAAVKCTLICIIFVPNIPIWVQMAALLSSEELDENTRQQILINQWAGMLSYALFFSLAIWAFGVGSGDLNITALSLAKTFSARVTLIVLAFPVLLFLLPYWTGTQRGNRFRLKLLRRRREFTAKLADILATPLPARYIPDLTVLQGEVKAEVSGMMASAPILAFHSANPDTPPDSMQNIKVSVEESKDLDPRFQHVDELLKFEDELEAIAADLQAQAPADLVLEAERWSKKYEVRKAELVTAMSSAYDAKPIILLAVGTLFSALVSSVLSDVGKSALAVIESGAVHK